MVFAAQAVFLLKESCLCVALIKKQFGQGEERNARLQKGKRLH